MDFHQPPAGELDDGARMMFRSRHIFVPLAELVNLGVGVYFHLPETGNRFNGFPWNH